MSGCFSAAGAPSSVEDSATAGGRVVHSASGCHRTGTSGERACVNDQECETPTYTVNDDGTVTSSCCALVWQGTDDGNRYSWAEAQSYCAGLPHVGDAAWRLPTVGELEWLLDYCESGSKFNPDAFLNASSGSYWSSTATSPTTAWLVGFSDGMSWDNGTADVITYRARCVH